MAGSATSVSSNSAALGRPAVSTVRGADGLGSAVSEFWADAVPALRPNHDAAASAAASTAGRETAPLLPWLTRKTVLSLPTITPSLIPNALPGGKPW